MRILQLHTRYRQPGGEDVVVDAEAELLRRRGHDVHRFEAVNPTEVAPTLRTLCLSPWNPTATRALRRALDGCRPDIAHVHNTWYALSPAVIRTLGDAGVPVVMTLHNFRLICANGALLRDGVPCEVCVGSHPWLGVRYRCYKDSAVLSAVSAATIALHRGLGTWTRNVDLLLVMTEQARACFERGGLPAERIRVKPVFVPDPGPRATRASASRTVLFVGRLSAEKGLGTLLDAWRTLDDPSLELVVLGDGPERAALESRQVPRVRFAGQVSRTEVARHMLRARALAVPSLCYESAYPLVALEAMAAGLPVLGPAHGGLRELLREIGPEWVVADGPQGWARSLRVLGDEGGLERASQRVMAIHRRRFTAPVVGHWLEDAYGQVLAGRTHG